MSRANEQLAAARTTLRSIPAAFERAAHVRLTLFCILGFLILGHGLIPGSFEVDQTTVALVLLMVIVALVPLLKSATLPGGGGLVFKEDVELLDQEVEELERSPRTPPPSPSQPPQEQDGKSRRLFISWSSAAGSSAPERIRARTNESPIDGLLLMAEELRRQANRVLVRAGFVDHFEPRSTTDAVRTLADKGHLPQTAVGAVEQFERTRNQAVHAVGQIDNVDLLRAIDAGLRIYDALEAIPLERNVVTHANVPIYADQALTELLPGSAVIMETTSPEPGSEPVERVYPTTRDYFEPGDELGWVWTSEHRWDVAWFAHPDSGQTTKSWDSSLEYIGPPLRLLS